MSNKFYYFFLIILISISFSCNEFQKVLKNDDIKTKYDMAESYYENQEFRRARRLFEQIKPKYRGKPQGERITFFYANCLLNTKNYLLSAYEFESFAKAYPLSEKVEDANYLSAFSYYKLSPVHSLDQDETNDAVEKLQEFINKYPNSERMSSANELVQELRIKLEFKAFEIAKQKNCEVKGISLSKNQIEYCKRKAKELNLDNQVKFELIDYREAKGKYDRIFSVGMFEHVGRKFYNTFY